MMKYTDSHAHYDDSRFDEDRDELLDALVNEMEIIVNVGADIETSRKSIVLSKMYDNIYATVGVHPHDVSKLNDKDIEKIEELALSSNKVVAIGEIGLDYYYDNSPREDQKKWFKKQIELAKKLNKSIIIHSRDASKDTMDIVKSYYDKNLTGVVHCFSGEVEEAKEYVKMGFFIGIGGVLTYKNARKLVEVVEQVPIENIVVETDAPYLSPDPNRGKRNDSRNIKYVINKISQIKNISEEEIVKITEKNLKKLYRMDC